MTKSWSSRLAGLFMVALGVCASLVIQLHDSIHLRMLPLPDKILLVLLLGFVILIGLWIVVKSIAQPNDPNSSSPGFLITYRDTWLRFKNQRWLVILTGVYASINVLGTVIEYAVQRYYYGDIAEQMMRSHGLLGMISRQQGFPPISVLLDSLPGSIIGGLYSFVPSPNMISSKGAQGLFALCAVVLLPCISRRMAALQEKSPHTSAMQFFRKLILPIGFLSLLVAAGHLYFLWASYSGLSASFSTQRHAVPLVSSAWGLFGNVHGNLSTIFYAFIVTPLFIGGLAGSLQRVVSGSTVTTESFMEDSIRTFTPIAGIFVLLCACKISFFAIWTVATFSTRNLAFTQEISWYELVSQPIMALLMLAPYAISSKTISMWGGVRESIRTWFICSYNLLSFTAFGVAVLIVAQMVLSIFHIMIGTGASRLAIIPTMIVSVINLVMSMFMAVAVWELYRRIRPSMWGND